jgi:hypothetical protein
MKSRLRIHLNYDRILSVPGNQVKVLSSDAESGNANLPAAAGGLRHAIQENGVPGEIRG